MLKRLSAARCCRLTVTSDCVHVIKHRTNKLGMVEVVSKIPFAQILASARHLRAVEDVVKGVTMMHLVLENTPPFLLSVSYRMERMSFH